MAVSLTDLVKDLSKEEILEDLLEIAKAVGLSTTAWRPGEPIWSILSIVSEKFSDFWNNIIVRAIRGSFLDYAEGVWLDLEAWTTYNVTRRQATFAETNITITNQGGGLYNFVEGDLQARFPNGATYTNVEGGTLASGAGQVLTLKFRADEAGSDASVATNTVVATPAQGPANITFSLNTEGVGQDQETDKSLRERCRLSSALGSVSGPKAAYEYVARSTRRPDGTDPERLLIEEATDVAVDVNRVRVIEGPGTVTVYLASPSGSVVSSDVDLVNQAIQLLVVPAGITATVSSASPIFVSYSITVRVVQESNLTTQEAEEIVISALEDFFADELPIGGHKLTPGGQGYVFADELIAVASQAHPAIYKAEITPTTDTAIDPDEVAVPTITVTATLVKQA